MKVYLDNAATTPLDAPVVEAMLPFMRDKFGNPSSTHSHGREVKAAIEMSRKRIAERLNCSPAEIYFTSGGTESNNCVLSSAANDLDIRNAITSPIEHHAVLHTLEHLRDKGATDLSMVAVRKDGHIDYEHLEKLLQEHPRSLVSLMHANNEIANVTDLKRVADLCTEHHAFLHSDTVQTMGHFPIDLAEIKAQSVVCSAHKIHGPKGVGFMFLRKNSGLKSFIIGGGQERNMRGGTENVIGIIGLAEAFVNACDTMEVHRKQIWDLKKRFIGRLTREIEGIGFNGDSESSESLYTVLNICLPPDVDQEMLLFKLDLEGISASGGSACSSGSARGSHVLEALNVPGNRGSVRFSFSKFTTEEEIDYALEKLIGIVNERA